METVLEGVMSQVDAVGSKLKMLERKGQLASSPGMVSGPSPGSSWFPTFELYHLFYSVGGGKTFLKEPVFRLLGQCVHSSHYLSGKKGVEGRPEVGCSGLRAAWPPGDSLRLKNQIQIF